MKSTTETKNQNNAVDNVSKEKKTKPPKEKKPKTTKTASHPPYFQMIKEALLALNEKNGSSPHAIAKYMEEKHKAVLPENFKKMLTLQLKNSASRGKLTKVKASYKLSESTTSKKEKASDAAKKPKSKRLSAKATETKRGGTVKKQGVVKKAKKMTPAKAKQAKSIKSPAAKKARKASV